MANICNPNPGNVTDLGSSKFIQGYACAPDSVSATSPKPFTVDDDESIPHLVPEVSDVSAYDYLALKSSIIAVERAIAGPTRAVDGGNDLYDLVNFLNEPGNGGFSSIADMLYGFREGTFVPLAGNLSHPMTGPLVMSSNQKTAWGQYCETYAIFAGTDNVTSLNLPAVNMPVVPFRNDGDGIPYTIPLSIVGHDATPNTAGTRHRRVRIFDDLDVVEDIRAGRDVIGISGYFTNLFLNSVPIDGTYVKKIGDDMTGNLNMFSGSSVRISSDNGKVSLYTPSSVSSPSLTFENASGIWSANARSQNLVFTNGGDFDVNVLFNNSTASYRANVAIDGAYKGLTSTGEITSSFVDLTDGTEVVIGSTPSSAYSNGDTVSPRHYTLPSSRANKFFNGSADLVEHLNNINAHHEEIHDLGSHLTYDTSAQTCRPIALPIAINKSFGEMLEALINHGNADIYHTHGGSSVTWGSLQFSSDPSSPTIIQYLQDYYCHTPCDGAAGSSDWDMMPRVSGVDSTRIQEFMLGKSVSPVNNRLVGSAGFVDNVSGRVYGYKPFWNALELSGSDTVTIAKYVSGTTSHEKGYFDTYGNGYGYLPYWGGLIQHVGGLTIEAWLNLNICSIISAQGCGGGGGGAARWGVLGKSDSEPSVLVEQFILGTAAGGTAVGYMADGTRYGYKPFWETLRKDGPSGTLLIDYLTTLESSLHTYVQTWVTNNICTVIGAQDNCGITGGGGGTVYWNTLPRANGDVTTIAQYITGISPGITGEIAPTTFGYKPYWGTLKQQAGGLTIEAWLTPWLKANICSILSQVTPTPNCGLGSGGGIASGSNSIAGGIGVYAPYLSVSGSAMNFSSLSAGSNIDIALNYGAYTISSLPATGTNIGTGQYSPYATAANNVLSFNKLNAGAGIAISGNTISATGSGGGVTVSNLGATGYPVYYGAVGSPVTAMSFGKLAEGTGVSISESSGVLTVASAGVSVAKAGIGTIELYSGPAGPQTTLPFKSLKSGAGVLLSEDQGTITVSATAATAKVPYIYPVNIELTGILGNTAADRDQAWGGRTKTSIMAEIATMYGLTDTNVANYTWSIYGGVYTCVNTNVSPANIKQFKIELSINVSGNFHITYNLLTSDPSATYNMKYQGAIMLIHI